MKYRGLFLDLDGTILNTIEDIRAAVNFSLCKHNIKQRSLEQIRQSIGHGSVHLIKTSIPNDVDENTFNSIFITYKQYYINNVNVYTKPYEGVKETLRVLKDNGIKIAVITNKPHDLTKQLIDIHFKDLIDLFIGIKEGINPKPNTQAIEIALNELGLKSKEVLFVGDSLVDYLTAKNALMDVLLCKYGFEKIENIKDKIDCPIINTFSDIRRYM